MESRRRQRVARIGRVRQAFLINAVWFGHSFLWNAIHPILLPVLLLSYAPGAKNASYGLLTLLGLLVALVVQPLSGALSDHTAHRLGRRRPWIVMGIVSGLVWLGMMSSAASGLGLAIGYMLLQLSSNVAQGPAQGLIPDLVPARRRGLAVGVKSLLEMLGVVAASLVVSRLLDRPLPLIQRTTGVIALVWVGAGAITVLSIRELDTSAWATTSEPLKSRVARLFAIRFGGLGDYGRLLVTRYCVLLGTYTLQSYGLFYFADVLELPRPAYSMGNMMTMIGLSVLVAALPAGVLSERYGRRRLSLMAIAVVAVGMAGLALMRRIESIWLLGIIIGLGMGVFSTVNWAWATELVPSGEPAKYLGLSNLATAGAAATSRLVGPLIDLCNIYRMNVGYSLMFIVALGGTALALLATLNMQEPWKNGQDDETA